MAIFDIKVAICSLLLLHFFSKHRRRECYKTQMLNLCLEQLQSALMEMDHAFSCSCFFDKLVLMVFKKTRVYRETS